MIYSSILRMIFVIMDIIFIKSRWNNSKTASGFSNLMKFDQDMNALGHCYPPPSGIHVVV